jgi:ADP-heptose:LPS heptosyltransferase
MLRKLNGFLILLVCFAYSLFRGRANKKLNEPKRFLVVQTAKLGDMVCTTPTFRAIKNKFPESFLCVAGSKTYATLLENNGDVDLYLTTDQGLLSSLKVLRKYKFDFACLLNLNFRILATLYLSGIRLITAHKIENGYSPQETRFFRMLRKLVVSKPHKMENYAPREYLNLLEPLGIDTNDTRKHLAYSKQAREKAEQIFRDNNIDSDVDLVVGISPSSGNKIKNWDSKKFAKLADYIYEKHGAKILVIGTDVDELEVDGMIDNINSRTKVINTKSLLNIEELKATISKMNIFISVDSGPIYIAEAFGVPTIDIVGPVHEKEQPPRGRLNKIVKAEGRVPAVHIMNARMYDESETRRQIDEISVDQVIEKYEELLGEMRLQK